MVSIPLLLPAVVPLQPIETTVRGVPGGRPDGAWRLTWMQVVA